jgi:ATP-dependent protease ClpP protease subunit
MKPILPEWLRLLKGELDGPSAEPVVLLLCTPIGVDPLTYEGMSSQRFGEILSYIPKERKVKLLINTPGGFIGEGIAMYNQMILRGNIETCVIGYAASMGAVVMQGGERRTMMKGTMVLLHPVQGGADTDEGRKIKAVATTNIVDILSSRTKNRRNVVAKLLEDTTAMGPDESKKMGFCDAVEDGEEYKNEIEPAVAVTAFQRLTNNVALKSDATGGPKKENMLKLLAILAKLNLIGSADVTEDQAVSQVETNHKNLLAERDLAVNGLKTAGEQAAASMKNRVSVAVKAAVAEKLVKAERETNLVEKFAKDENGLTEYINDLRDLKGQTPTPPAQTPPARRGAPPVPPEKKEGEVKTSDDQIVELQNRMKNETPAQQYQTAQEINKLRGFSFGATAAK